jgi:hypothetical protein
LTDRTKIIANALRQMADRLERGEVYALTMQSFVEVAYPTITADDGRGNIEIGRVRDHWMGMVTVTLPEGSLADEMLETGRYP